MPQEQPKEIAKRQKKNNNNNNNPQNTWRLNSMLLNKQWIAEEIKGQIKKYLEELLARWVKNLTSCLSECGLNPWPW